MDSFVELQWILLARVLRRLTAFEEGVLFTSASLAAADAATDALVELHDPGAAARALERLALACVGDDESDRGYRDEEEAGRIAAGRALLGRMAGAMAELVRTGAGTRAGEFARHLRDFERAGDALCELCEEFSGAI